ncbi:TPA: LPXTG cell wall anchor domain-containing protein [Streptococcus suis]|nr:LPXTG cell wall anchor domain-containing protein [Streptococcus suis]HEM4551457.1 LPXTG cell wall anchor domain-containing protein [Streptococcus suis]HEM4557306.1 LPXTG cell wall anchor domain-containing protein [Streptococcus suis]HEM4642732.1 LPXTG cell wall anchor domain-containing protein [Streptococcus suis]HEM6031914.1 LPXTG cell wall anchor domain-containing protein [Streptococcus suis]
MNTKKLVKWGVALTSTLVLGGVVAPVGGNLANTSTVVHAEEQSVAYRIHYFLNDVVENGGTPSYTDIAPYKEGVISKGEVVVEVAPHIDGYVPTTESWSKDSIELTYEKFTGENVWHDEDWYPVASFFYDKVDTPTEQPADQSAEQPTEQPADQPVETPAEQPVDTPTDKPVEQLTDASSLTDQTAGKVQTVTPTDKKTVDKSALSTPAVKPQEVSQPVAKTLPKTGDSSSTLLVLGGILSGLSGLGLAATSRKRD